MGCWVGVAGCWTVGVDCLVGKEHIRRVGKMAGCCSGELGSELIAWHRTKAQIDRRPLG